MDIRIIANYFGRPLPYFQLWLDSCGRNNQIKWLFFTDFDMSGFFVPTNVKIIHTDFIGMKNRIEKSFDYTVRYQQPWDFCSFRPTFGSIFAEELSGADYWGWCDCDMIYGDLSPCVEACGKGFCKVMPKGHLSFIRNDLALNSQIKSHKLCVRALASNGNGLPCFDEVAFVREILPELNVSQYNEIPFVNTACRHGHFVLDDTAAMFEALGIEDICRHKYPFVVTMDDTGMIAQFAIANEQVKKIQIAYFHFFRRNICAKVDRLIYGRNYIIKPNNIEEYDGRDLSANEIRKMDRFRIHWDYYRKRIKPSFLLSKLSSLGGCR